MSTPIAIIGAGPSGLVLAHMLQIHSIPYTLFERETSRTLLRQGGCLDLHEQSGQLALRACGLLEAFQKVARYDAQETFLMDTKGKVIMHEAYTGQQTAPEIDRGQLRDLLCEGLEEEGKVRWGSKAVGLSKGENGTWTVELADGERVEGFWLVVGADGAWSVVRKWITSATPIYSGFHYLQTLFPASSPAHARLEPKLGRGSVVAMGQGKQFATQRQADGSYNVYVGLQLPAEWGRTEVSHHQDPNTFRDRLLREEFGDWATEFQEVIRSSEGVWHSWPLYAMDPEALTWTSVPGLVLIGDAAHVSTPFVGEGVNCSMLDALRLGEAIGNYGLDKLDQAIHEYERDMFVRGAELIKRSTASGQLMFAPDAPAGFVPRLDRESHSPSSDRGKQI